MVLTTRVEPIDRDIEVIIKESLSPAAQSAAFAGFAEKQIEEAKRTNKTVLGRVPRYEVFVDGRKGAQLRSVKPAGVIVAEFELFNDVLGWIGEQLVAHSPFLTGRYENSHVLYADGLAIDVGAQIPPASEFAFVNSVPYARKIERGASSQAPDGVYQAVSVLARQRFGNVAKISFSYRTAIAGAFVGGRAGNKSDLRNPAIIIKLRGD